MSIEQSEVYSRVAQAKVDRKWLLVRVFTQSIIVAGTVAAVSLLVTAFLVVKVFHLEHLIPMALVCVGITMSFTVIGMILLNLWNQ
jgi:hypothetical protein